MLDQEYFTVHHALTVNIEPLPLHFVLPSYQEFEAEIPAPFIVANEFSQLDHLNEAARNELRATDFKQVIQLLDSQNNKLNLLLTYMLSQQDHADYRYKTQSFGASQFSYISQISLDARTWIRAKLFLESPASAIYCYGQVTECEAIENHFVISVKYHLMRDIDQDLIIKAALHQQQKILRQRSLARDSK